MDKFTLACKGKSASQGGMNIGDLKKELIKKYPKDRNKISIMKRDEITDYCSNISIVKKKIEEYEDSYFLPNSGLSKEQKKYCRCISHISTKNRDWCYKHKAWKTQCAGCINPYSLCTKQTKRKGNVDCASNMNFRAIPKDELHSLAKLKGKTINQLKSGS